MDNLESLLENLKNLELKLNKETNEEIDSQIEQELKSIFGVTNQNNNLNVGVKLLHENAKKPAYSNDGDAGADLTITSIISEDRFQITYGFGLAFEIPYGYVGLVFPRSSVRNTNLSLKNCVGVIDSTYRGEVQVTFRKHEDDLTKNIYVINERGAQIIILPYPKINYTIKEELSITERGSGGFGSTN